MNQWRTCTYDFPILRYYIMIILLICKNIVFCTRGRAEGEEGTVTQNNFLGGPSPQKVFRDLVYFRNEHILNSFICFEILKKSAKKWSENASRESRNQKNVSPLLKNTLYALVCQARCKIEFANFLSRVTLLYTK